MQVTFTLEDAKLKWRYITREINYHAVGETTIYKHYEELE